MEFRILGPLEVLDEGRPLKLGSARQRTLLAALLVCANEVVSADRLADALWGDDQPTDTSNALQTYVSRLRRVVDPETSSESDRTLISSPPGYVLKVGPGKLDAAQFETMVAEAHRVADADPARGLVLLTEALGLWQGPALAEFADAEFARAEAARLEGLREAATGKQIDLRLQLGQHAELIGELEALVAGNPLQEQHRAQLMLALYSSGRQVEALRAFQEYRRYLADEMGLEPSSSLQDLERRMVRQDPELGVARGAEAHRPKDHGAGSPATATRPALHTVNFLCTDIEGSTRLWDEHPDEMHQALARHDAILSDAVKAHGGEIFKTTGDGAYARLPTVADAVAAAAEAARTLEAETWGSTGPLSVRASIHTGDVEPRDGDYYGPALNRTSRLLTASHGGQILLTSASAAIVRDELADDLELVDLGLHRLRGIVQPEHVYQLNVPGLRTEFPPLQTIDAFATDLPTVRPSFTRVGEELAGRSVELDRLESSWRRAGEGTRRVALIAGESGIGKTRLVGELASVVDSQNGAVLYGRCDEDMVVPYQPFVEALQPYVSAYPAAALHERLHGLEQDLTRLFPELLGRIVDQPLPTLSDPEAERYRLFEAITLLVTGVAAAGPAVLVLDDLHWADRPTILLLRHVVRSAADAPLLVVACYRDFDLPAGHEVADLLADLRRESFTERIALQGLSEADSATMLAAIAGHDVAPALTRELHREAGGNPFFLAELLRNLLETNPELVSAAADGHEVDLRQLELPQSVRDVVARRVRRLPEQVHEILSLASVIGPDVPAFLLANAGDRPASEVLEALDLAKEAGLVNEPPDRTGSYSFSHDLVRQVLYAELGSARKAQLHARIGGAMEQEVTSKQSPALLAEHFMHALVLGEAPRALEYTTAAAREAAAHLALEDAVAHFEQAISLIEEHFPAERAQRIELLIELAEVLIYVDEAAGASAALRAVDAARSEGSPEQFGRAIAVFAELDQSYPGKVDELLDEAQRVLGDEHHALRARLMAIEAFKLSAYQLEGHGRDGRELADRAVRLAREAGDPRTLTVALFARATSLESTALTGERQALGEEMIAIGRAGGSRAARATTQGLRVVAGVHLELGDADALTSTIAELARAGEQLRWLPALVFAAQWRATQALLQGRFDDVKTNWHDMRRYARAYRAVGAIGAQQGYYLAREQGELSPLLGPLEEMAAAASESLYVPAMLAVAQLDTANEAAALRTLDSVSPSELRRAGHESAWGAVLASLAEVAATVDSRSHAALFYELLQPFAGRLISTVIGLACLGAAERYQGMLSTTLERWDDAEAHFERALELEQRIRGRALLPRTRYWQAKFLRRRARPGDDEAAAGLLGAVLQETQSLGMLRLREQAEHLLAS